MAKTRPRRCQRSPEWHRELGRYHLGSQAESGLTVQDYCFAHGLKTHTFYNWRRCLNHKTQGPDAGAPELKLPTGPVFAEVLMDPLEEEQASWAIEIVLDGERRHRVRRGFGKETLQRLVALLESV